MEKSIYNISFFKITEAILKSRGTEQKLLILHRFIHISSICYAIAGFSSEVVLPVRANAE